MLKIGIVDDHGLFRAALKNLIESFENVDVAIDANSGEEFFDFFPKTEIDLLLLDLQMPGMSGFEVCTIMRKKYPDVRILIITQCATNENIKQAISSGAHGILTKNSDIEQLANAIKSIKLNNFFMDKEFGSLIKDVIQRQEATDSNSLLDVTISKRELQVIEMACRGYNSSEISEKLFINARTVETHRKRIMEKTNSKNFWGSILYTLKKGLIKLEDIP